MRSETRAAENGGPPEGATMPEPQPQTRTVKLHGHEVCYQEIGAAGPVLVLLHGIAGSSTTWAPVIRRLATRARVVVPDLLGHGQSAKPRGDYSLGAYASGVRDLLTLLGYDGATVVGHSLGGGIAMQFAYQHPERCERLVLVSSGGLGPDVSLWLRAATLPGAEVVLPIIAHGKIRDAGAALGRLLGRLSVTVTPAAEEVARSYASLADPQTRAAFLATLRTVVDARGQRVSATDRLYLAAHMPTLLVWGSRDGIIPVAHGAAAHAAMPGSRLEVFEGSGHFPHRDQPERFTSVLLDFLAGTEPAQSDVDSLRQQLVERR